MTTTPLWFKLSMATLTAVSLLVAVVMMPLIANERAYRTDRSHLYALSERYATAGADAKAAGDLVMAGRSYAAALELHPADDDLRAALADVHIEQILGTNTAITDANAGQLQLELSERMLAGRRDAKVLTAYGKVLLYRGFPEAARERLREAVAADGELTVAHIFLADALLRAEEWTGAAASAERALSIAPEDGLAHFAMGKAQSGLEKWDLAARHFTKAAELTDTALVWRALAETEAKREKWVDAEKAWAEVLERQPNNVEAYAPYARALAFNGKLVPAARYFSMAYERTGDVDAYASLGDVALRAKDFKRATKVFGEVIRARSGDPEMTCRLGFAQEGLGDLERAKVAFTRCARQSTGIKGRERLARTAAQKVAELNEKLAAAGAKPDE